MVEISNEHNVSELGPLICSRWLHLGPNPVLLSFHLFYSLFPNRSLKVRDSPRRGEEAEEEVRLR